MTSNLFRDFKDAVRHSGQCHGYQPVRPDFAGRRYAKSSHCAKAGCKGITSSAPRDRFMIGNIQGSPYCYDHACQHWDGPLVCKNSTKRGEGSCESRKIYPRSFAAWSMWQTNPRSADKQCNDPRCTNCQKVTGKKRSPYCTERESLDERTFRLDDS